jgi:hypothetical protein
MGGAITTSPLIQYDAESLRKIAGDYFDQRVFDQYAKDCNGQRVVDYEDLVKLSLDFRKEKFPPKDSECDHSARTISTIATESTDFMVNKQFLNSQQNFGKLEGISPRSMGHVSISAINSPRFLVADAPTGTIVSKLERQNTLKSTNGVAGVPTKLSLVCAEGHCLQIIRAKNQGRDVPQPTIGDIVCAICNEDDVHDSPFYFCAECNQIQCHYCATGCCGEHGGGAMTFDDSETPHGAEDDGSVQ